MKLVLQVFRFLAKVLGGLAGNEVLGKTAAECKDNGKKAETQWQLNEVSAETALNEVLQPLPSFDLLPRSMSQIASASVEKRPAEHLREREKIQSPLDRPCPSPRKRSREAVAVDDDDSAAESALPFAEILRRLSGTHAEAAALRFSSQGVFVEVDLLLGCSVRSVPVSCEVAQCLAGSTAPQSQSARTLRKGRLATVDLSGDCSLALPPEAYHVEKGTSKRLLLRGNNFFNFLTRQWHPLSKLVAYEPGRKVLYCAFRPNSQTLFVKVGYRALGGQAEASLVGYLEKKTDELRLTNCPGAGLFVMPLPRDHTDSLSDPARAAEESLKSVVTTSQVLHAVPTGNRADVGVFSASLEYYFVCAKQPDHTPLQALTTVLRGFTGDCDLLPYRVVAHERGTGQKSRRGRKTLVSWCEEDGSCETPTGRLPLPRGPLAVEVVDLDADPAPVHAVLASAASVPRKVPLQRASVLRSRFALRAMAAKHAAGAFRRRFSKRRAFGSFGPPAKRQRRALSCP